ncbi:MAG: hypothetical protein BWY29_00956 [Microgenomates group bacterium ADurb.Bin238]|jgi:D-arabinose 1-dehydrogenase-like Zn-dependent alcohol dehydrogenase|nr:MAG: hypothetical protein BWY29_00956 [Microgenomates group bacterium ADurb.Bin238]
MTETITRDGDIITINRQRETIEQIDLGVLQDELNSLQEMTKPETQEVLNLAKDGIIHPYYEPSRKLRIAEIEEILERYNGS